METKSLTSSRTSEKDKKNVKIGFQFSFRQAAAFYLNIPKAKKLKKEKKFCFIC